MDGTCSMHGRDEKCLQILDGRMKLREPSEVVGFDVYDRH
jgi:hypothetical protein